MWIDYQSEAEHAVTYISHELGIAHRGGFAWGVDVGVLFENRARRRDHDAQIEFLRDICCLADAELLAIAYWGRSWALLIEWPSEDGDQLHDIAWAAWSSAIPTLPALRSVDYFREGDICLTEADAASYHTAQRIIAGQYVTPAP